ncbi:MAG: SDR family oxidoreductase [Cyanobacteriota bacterium]|nr:SDR family oxidoreductase [Cyanobacteriota bacterium]
MSSLTGKVAIVTGASRGIGRAIAKRLARDGADVVVNYVSNAAKAQEVVSEIEANGQKALAVKADLGQIPEIRNLFKETISFFGKLDILVNNASFFPSPIPLTEVTEEDFDQVFAINAKGNFFSLQEAARHMKNGGRIVNFSSSVTVAGAEGYTHYSGTRAAIELFTKSAAKELGPRGITVNTVAPGPTDTELFRASFPEGKDAEIAKASPLGRIAQPEDIADIVAFIVSHDARWITGQLTRAVGGTTAS